MGALLLGSDEADLRPVAEHEVVGLGLGLGPVDHHIAPDQAGLDAPADVRDAGALQDDRILHLASPRARRGRAPGPPPGPLSPPPPTTPSPGPPGPPPPPPPRAGAPGSPT